LQQCNNLKGVTTLTEAEILSADIIAIAATVIIYGAIFFFAGE
jgi:hypothetical protein